jgi:DNA polymerase (family 10)
VPGVEEVAVAGEARRRCELVAGPCVVAAARDPQEVQARVGAAGVRVTVVPRAQFAAALLYATGAPAHIAQLEQRAAAAGIKFSREGLARDDKMLPAPSEKDIYAALGLPFIEPEWREGRDEIEAAAAGRLPAPLKVSDLLGILHCHTRYSDGSNTVEEMAEAVREMGFRYLGVADHSKSAFYAGGLDESEIRAQHEEIERLNTRYAREGFRIFKGIESDILADGALDYSDEVLASFDFIVASIHSHFELDEEKQTARIEKALAHPAATILGHPTGRLLRRRAGHPVNLDRVLQACAKHGVAVELNAHPERLDLDWRWHARVLELGLKVSISPDAHSLPELAHIRYGVDIARKGRLPAGSILNALDAERLAEFFRRRS